ncbi:MAG: PTS lactose/cellobiose-specific transporter subunit IIB [Firmicutes bacterium HGW-Firmicutes-1]|jgi:mannitol operon transcriptional antiterminator|nr:MAG: PTS lactose/cellobiose-specific transporter subunit IIB [Firmicutes bacterium HGW-Firmicutes-1]
MKMTSRVKKIITILLNQQDYITTQEISEEINVSTRTVLRELDSVERCLAEKNVLLEKKKGLGIKIIIEKQQLEEMMNWIQNEKTELTESPEQRHTVLKAELLKEQGTTKLYTLTYSLDVTESTISNDLDNIQDWFEKFELKLIRKPGLGVYIEGSEKSKRRAIVALLYEHFHEADLIKFIINNEWHKSLKTNFTKIDEVVYDLMEISEVALMRDFLKYLETYTGYQLADHSYIALIIRFIVTRKRIHQGLTITIDQELKKALKNEKIYFILEQWSKENLAVKMDAFPEDELFYLVMHIKGATLRETFSENRISMIEDFKMIKLAKKIIRIAENNTNVYLEDNEKLLSGLVRHLGPAINRIKLKLDVMNPLVKEIKEMYPSLFSVAIECVKIIEEEENIIVPEDEVAYIATHIGSAIKYQNRRTNTQYRVIVACGSGIGTSQLLAAEIEKEFHNIDIVDIVSTLQMDNDRIKALNVDLMISTISIPNCDLPTIHVNCILTDQDKVEIKKFLEGFMPKPHLPNLQKIVHLNEKLTRLKHYCDTILEVVDNFQLFEDIEINDLKELIQFVSAQIVSSENARNELEKAFIDREEKGSTILGKKSMMLLHTRSSAVDQLYFMIVRGKDKIPIYNNKNILVDLDVIVVMVAPISIKHVELEVLSEISRMIITSEFADLLKSGTKRQIFEVLSSILDQFIQSKVIVTE